MITFLTSTPTPLNLGDLLDQIGNVVTESVEWITSFLSQITTANGLLLLPFAMGFALFGTS